jgi:hypothetical protein
VRLRPADLRLGGVQAQLNAAGVGVGDHVGQGPQAQARLAGDGEAAGGQQRPDLVDGAGDGGAIHPVQHRQGLVRELEAQNHEGHQDPVAEDQPVAGSASFGRFGSWVARVWPVGAMIATVTAALARTIQGWRSYRDRLAR